jgi:uncharacterized membrane protein YcaP (DUF421 family)
LVGNALYDSNVKIRDIVFTVVLWGLFMYLIEIITQKYISSRRLLEGETSVVIDKGVINYKELKKNKLDINQLQSLVRQQGFFSLQEVEFALLETNGVVSVLPRAQYLPTTKGDINMSLKPTILPITLITDGVLIQRNLNKIGKDENWLKKQLAEHQISYYNEVLLAEWKETQPLFIMKYKKLDESKNT